MQALGIYFDITQASQAPTLLFGWSILVWGVMLFTITSLSIIIQLWWRLQKYENAYEYALTTDKVKLELSPNTNNYGVIVEVINSINRPMFYKLDTRLDMYGQKPVIDSDGGIIVANQTGQFGCFDIDTPKNFPSTGILYCELLYGPPKKLIFKQITEYDVLLKLEKDVKGQTILLHTFTIKKREDFRVK